MGRAWQLKADFALFEYLPLQKEAPILLLQAALCLLGLWQGRDVQESSDFQLAEGE